MNAGNGTVTVLAPPGAVERTVSGGALFAAPKLYRMHTTAGEQRIIGFGGSDLTLLGAAPTASLSTGELLGRLRSVGYVSVWEYRVYDTTSGERVAAPVAPTPVFARDIRSLESFGTCTVQAGMSRVA